MTKKYLLVPLVATSLFATQAMALATGTLSFRDQTGTVASDQAIEIWLRLTLDENSEALITDASGTPTSGFAPSDYSGSIDLSDPNTRINLNEFFECTGDFTSGCGTGAYEFNFNFDQPNFIGPANFTLQPGGTFEWKFGTFTPVGGNAAPGTYRFFNAGAIVQISNQGDPDDPNDDQYDSVTIAQTCTGQNPQCAFTRTVVQATGAVPEPATWAMMILGFGAIGGAMRVRRRAVSFG